MTTAGPASGVGKLTLFGVCGGGLACTIVGDKSVIAEMSARTAIATRTAVRLWMVCRVYMTEAPRCRAGSSRRRRGVASHVPSAASGRSGS